MMSRSWQAAMVSMLIVAACSGDTASGGAITLRPGGETPEATVEELIAFLEVGDFDSAASLAIPNQAALAALAEGATVADVASAVRDGDATVAANFWSGFAQSISDVLNREPTVTGSAAAEAEGARFAIVDVATANGGERQFVTRDQDGHRVDIFATFGPVLAGRLYSPLERLLNSPTDDAVLILSEMREQIPSLYMAAQTPDLAAGAIQEVLRLIELISRVS